MDFPGSWVSSTFLPQTHKTSAIGAAYVKIQDYISTCGLYLASSYEQWEPEDKADPWLIAVAMTLKVSIVTNEVSEHPTDQQKMRRESKIPDVAKAFDVETMNLREFFDVSGLLGRKPYPIQLTL